MMKPKHPGAKLNDTQHNSRNHALFNSLSYHNVHNGKLLPQCTSSKFSAEHADSVVEIKTNFVTGHKNVEANSSHISRITKKLAEPNEKPREPFSKTFSFVCFSILLFAANVFILQMKTDECEKCCHEIIELKKILLKMTDQTHNLAKIVTDVSGSYRLRMDDVNSKSQRHLNSTRKRSKRSDEDTSPWDQIRSRDTVAVQFSGSKPFGFPAVPSEGILGPWAESANDYSIVEEFGAQLNDGNSTLKISQGGSYIIYAQVTYVSFVNSNSYSIQVIPHADKAHVRTVTTCSSPGKITKIGEISCYTSVIEKLHAGDVVYIQQAQPNREIVFSKAYTYFGLILLF